MGQEAPGTPATHDVEDGIDDLAQGVHSRASGCLGGREVGLYAGPLGIGEVGLICSSNARYSTELPPHDTYSDSYKASFGPGGEWTLQLQEITKSRPSRRPPFRRR